MIMKKKRRFFQGKPWLIDMHVRVIVWVHVNNLWICDIYQHHEDLKEEDICKDFSEETGI